MNSESSLRSHLIDQLTSNNAHVGLEKAVEGLSIEEAGAIPDGCSHSVWMLVEHIRIAQYDILDFSRNPDYDSRTWPDDYWPEHAAPASQSEWDKTLSSIAGDREEMISLIKDTDNDLLEPRPHGDGQTLFREAMLLVDHNAYHIGQIVQLRRLMGNW